MVKQGINPAHSRQLERIKRRQESATTFEAVATEWLALKDWEEVTKTHRLAMLKRVVFPKIGALPVKQITSAHVLDVLTGFGCSCERAMRSRASVGLKEPPLYSRV